MYLSRLYNYYFGWLNKILIEISVCIYCIPNIKFYLVNLYSGYYTFLTIKIFKY